MTPSARVTKATKALKASEQAYVLAADILREFPDETERLRLDEYHALFRRLVQDAERARERGGRPVSDAPSLQEMRDAGMSWREIGNQLGISRQAAQQAFRRKTIDAEIRSLSFAGVYDIDIRSKLRVSQQQIDRVLRGLRGANPSTSPTLPLHYKYGEAPEVGDRVHRHGSAHRTSSVVAIFGDGIGIVRDGVDTRLRRVTPENFVLIGRREP